MKNQRNLFIIILIPCLLTLGIGFAQETITLNAADGLEVTADLYESHLGAPYIVLCHLSEHSRGEYRETAVRLNKLGFNCLALDTRTGDKSNGIINQTAAEAKKHNKPTDFLSSEQDIIAAIDFAYTLNRKRPVILLGSSFSASLSLKIGTDNEKVNAVIAFSPREQFGDRLNLKSSIQNFSKNLFVTSSKQEVKVIAELIKDLPSDKVVHFIPKNEGFHGSISLWDYNSQNTEYWEALIDFLKQIHPNTTKLQTLNTMNMKLNAGIITNKLEETKEFYTNQLNFGVKFENEFYVLLHSPNGEDHISFLLPNHPSQKPIFQKPFKGQGMYLTIEVDDVDKLYNELKQQGVSIEIEIRNEPWGDRHFAIVDPNGIGIDLVTYSDPNKE